MEEKNENIILLEKIERNSRRQARWAMLQCLFTAAAAICCGALVYLGLGLLPQIQELAGQVDIVLTNLDTVTGELAKVDFEGLVSNMDSFISSSQSSVQQAMEKVNSIDLETLNKAISDLSKVVEPLANFFKKFS